MLQKEIRAASADDLAEERDPSRLLVFAKHYIGPTEEPLDVDDSPRLTFALLRAIRGASVTGSLDSRAVRSSPVLNWNCLIDLYDSEEVLETRSNDLKAQFEVLKPWLQGRRTPLDEAERLLEFANEYLRQWRPESH